MQITEEEQWVLATKADPQAMKYLYQRYFPKVYAYMSYRVGRVQDVEDLVAETFMQAVSQFAHFQWQGVGSFAAWLFRIAHNQVANFYRRQQRAPEAVTLEELPEIAANGHLPDDLLLRKEQFYQLLQLLKTLSTRRQEIITLKFFGGLRNQEIAEILALDERTVASHLCRGLEDLSQRYAAELQKER
jgi:RNA polymerase sigma-70 factor (ECF subfamily)